MVAPFPDRPSRLVASTDGTRIAVFSAPRPETEAGAAARLPLLLVHGTTADHRTWRVVAPELARRWPLHAIDRRGRGDSGDGRLGEAGDGLPGDGLPGDGLPNDGLPGDSGDRAPGEWRIERELDDLVAVAEALAADAGADAIDVVGHSLGGRIALAASRRTAAIRRVVAYESAPPAEPETRGDLVDALRADLERGDHDALLARFMREAVGMPEPDLAAFRADPVWPLRAAAAPTIVRELEAAGGDPAIGMDALAGVTVPVLQLAGSAGFAGFREAAAALDARLADGRLEIIDGARHAAHHSHPAAFIDAVERFLRA